MWLCSYSSRNGKFAMTMISSVKAVIIDVLSLLRIFVYICLSLFHLYVLTHLSFFALGGRTRMYYSIQFIGSYEFLQRVPETDSESLM